MSHKLHKHCIGKNYTMRRYAADDRWARDNVVFSVTAPDNDHPDRETTVSQGVLLDTLHDCDDDDKLMFGVLSHYIHEAGEHITFDSGATYNQHTSEGATRMLKVLKRVVHHLQRLEAQNA